MTRSHSRPKLSIRRATAADAPFIERLSTEAFGEYSPRAGASTLSMLARSRALTIVAELDEQRIGFASLTFEPGFAHLLALAVLRHERGNGFGKQLLEAAVRRARRGGAPALELVTADSNLEGLHLFLRSGFQVVEQRPQYYARGQNALRLRRVLTTDRP